MDAQFEDVTEDLESEQTAAPNPFDFEAMDLRHSKGSIRPAGSGPGMAGCRTHAPSTSPATAVSAKPF